MASDARGRAPTTPVANTPAPMWKFFVYSLIGGVVFFVPVTVGEKSSIILDHIVTAILDAVPAALPYFALVLILAGAGYPFVSGTWSRSTVDKVFSAFKVIGLLITNRVYKEGKYSAREAAIIATGFSTVSATFMVVVATTLDLMGSWNTYFWSTLLVTFLVTAVTVRIWPLSTISDNYFEAATAQPEPDTSGRRFSRAWCEARQTVAGAPTLVANIAQNLRDGVLMAMAVLPSILSIGLLGLVLARYTPVFDLLGYLFYPVTWALQIPEPLLAARASAVGIAEMFLPSLLLF